MSERRRDSVQHQSSITAECSETAKRRNFLEPTPISDNLQMGYLVGFAVLATTVVASRLISRNDVNEDYHKDETFDDKKDLDLDPEIETLTSEE